MMNILKMFLPPYTCQYSLYTLKNKCKGAVIEKTTSIQLRGPHQRYKMYAICQLSRWSAQRVFIFIGHCVITEHEVIYIGFTSPYYMPVYGERADYF